MNADQLENEIAESVTNLLLPYLEKFHTHRIDVSYGEIEVKGQVDDKETSKTLVLRVVVNHDERQMYIPNIFMPEFMKRSGIGKQVIARILDVAESHGYHLLIVDLVPSFYNRLVKRGAVVIEEDDIVLITRETDLSHKYA